MIQNTPVAAEELSCSARLGPDFISAAVQQYINNAVSRHLRMHSTTLEIGSIVVRFDLQEVHSYFLEGQLNINRTFNALLEVVNMYKCDALLLTGRPSNLPGIQGHIRRLMPLSPNPNHSYAKLSHWRLVSISYQRAYYRPQEHRVCRGPCCAGYVNKTA